MVVNTLSMLKLVGAVVMWKEEHEERCVEFFGKPYSEVHEFLDSMANKVGLEKHRQYLHNPEGVEKVVELFGEDARCPALLHLYDDFEYYQYWTTQGKLRTNVTILG